MPEIRIDRIIRRLTIPRISIIEAMDIDNTRSAIDKREVVKLVTNEYSAITQRSAVEGINAPEGSAKLVCVVAVNNVVFQLCLSLQKT